MKELGYSTISVVLETWDAAKFSEKDFEEEFGRMAVAKYVIGHVMIIGILLMKKESNAVSFL